MSAGGCLVQGSDLPDVDTRVFLSLEIAGLPNVRLSATVVRRLRSRRENTSALRFDLPPERIDGIARLLEAHVRADRSPLVALVVDSDSRSQVRVRRALEARCDRVLAVDNAIDAVACARAESIGLLLARADAQGLSALAAFMRESSATFRVAFGRGQALITATTLGFAEATTDDPCSAKCLNELLDRRAAQPS